ncbi:hypothetical protein SVIO_017120 [Streptomyces violaceusniger]|uniref:Uncharacterized protein n=1 Tax=Streptomyces violaceusniger TaxID=68280 RepID=A0A4D4KZ25_STRVO|nr:hypothetical protein SVIO_017120 [Streptomyces violaceusniger]
MTADRRPEPPHFGDERETLRAFLDYQRATLAMKCEGLTDEELRQRSMPPSTLTLLGLVRHMAEVERAWFRRVFEDNDAPMVWSPVIDFQAAYDVSEATGAEAFAAWGRRSRRPAGSNGRRIRSTWRVISPGGARRCRCGWCWCMCCWSTGATTGTRTSCARAWTGSWGPERSAVVRPPSLATAMGGTAECPPTGGGWLRRAEHGGCRGARASGREGCGARGLRGTGAG